jgi:hypothetical protein
MSGYGAKDPHIVGSVLGGDGNYLWTPLLKFLIDIQAPHLRGFD